MVLVSGRRAFRRPDTPDECGMNLSNYQMAARDWLLARPGAVLADAPGVGKTHPALSAAASLGGPVLVVCPAYLVGRWHQAQEELGVGARVASYHALASYRAAPPLLGEEWAAVIFDEAHYLRGRHSRWTVHARQLQARHRWLLSGTPAPNSAADWHSLLRVAGVERQGYWDWIARWVRVRRTPFASTPLDPLDPQAFAAYLSPYVLRRTLAEVGLDPGLAIEDLPVTEAAVASATRSVCESWRTLTGEPIDSAGALAHFLRGLTVAPKLEAAKRLVEAEPHPNGWVGWAWDRETAAAAAAALGAGVAIDGSKPVRLRSALVDAWRANPVRPLVATLSSLGEGVDLQPSCRAILLEEGWLASTTEQALARQARRGATEPVIAYRLWVRRTADAAVRSAVLRREALSESTLGAIMGARGRPA